jgi:hypothetical protein
VPKRCSRAACGCRRSLVSFLQVTCNG